MHAISISSVGLQILLALFLALGRADCAAAQDASAPPVIENPSSGTSANAAAASARSVKRDPITTFFEDSLTLYEFWLVFIIIVMSLLTICCVTRYVARSKNFTPKDIWLPAIVLSIIGAILIAVTAGYRVEQIGPAFGLFGTMIGYLLRSLSGNSDPEDYHPTQSATGVARETTASGNEPGAASAGGAKE